MEQKGVAAGTTRGGKYVRHSLFFSTIADAEKAQAKINETVIGLVDSYQTNDGESRDVELRFFTDAALEDWMQRFLIQVTRPKSYDFNRDE